jgi:glycosyltransferase involved in cell wall biosynthesis
LLDPKICVLIPAYNEIAHIGQVVTGSLRFLPVLVADDGSTDRTAEAAEKSGAEVIRQVPNQGKGAALRAGFTQCIQHGMEAIITLDADGQHDPEEIPLFVQAYRESRSGLIIGQRDFSSMPFTRKLANTLGGRIISRALGKPIPDNQSGYRLISAHLAEMLLTSEESGFEFEVEMLALSLKYGLGLGWVPIRTIYADEKSHIRPLHHVLHYFRIVSHARRILLSQGS